MILIRSAAAMAAALAVLAGCSDLPSSDEAPATAQSENRTTAERPLSSRATDPGSLPEQPDPSGAALEAADAGTSKSASRAGLRFVGDWASETGNCKDKAWRFTATSLRTPAGSQCSFTRVTPVPGGYDIAASCTAEGPPTKDRIEIRFAESAGAMLFESGAVADASLIQCTR